MATNGLEMNCGLGLGALALVVSGPRVDAAPPLCVSESVEFTARLQLNVNLNITYYSLLQSLYLLTTIFAYTQKT
jgi:hypothetical protein